MLAVSFSSPATGQSAKAVTGAPQVAPTLWSQSAKHALLEALADRARHGLDHLDFLEAGLAASDEAFSAAALRYAGALAHGTVDPTALHSPFTLSRPTAALAPGLAKALGEGRVREWLAGLAPTDPDYTRLSQAYLDLHGTSSADAVPEIAGGLLKPGNADPRVTPIVEQLIMGEYLPSDTSAFVGNGLPRYTRRIANAIKVLQRDYGIAADGIVGPDTLAVLNLGPGDRARAIAVALERRRWLDRDPPATRIDVNTAASLLHYYRGGVLVDTRRVVVGKPGTETPQLQSPIYRLVANPTWTVPRSIQRGELAGVTSSYLRRNNMEMRGGWIVQRSGRDNALGLVKFDMHNDHAIYLHDTSAPALFARSNRHRSHGCVRVEDALGFAQLLAEDQEVLQAWDTAQLSGEQQFVALKMRIPVRLIYRNVFVDRDGKVAFRTDPYGWNAPVAKALGFSDRQQARVRSDEADIAP